MKRVTECSLIRALCEVVMSEYPSTEQRYMKLVRYEIAQDGIVPMSGSSNSNAAYDMFGRKLLVTEALEGHLRRIQRRRADPQDLPSELCLDLAEAVMNVGSCQNYVGWDFEYQQVTVRRGLSTLSGRYEDGHFIRERSRCEALQYIVTVYLLTRAALRDDAALVPGLYKWLKQTIIDNELVDSIQVVYGLDINSNRTGLERAYFYGDFRMLNHCLDMHGVDYRRIYDIFDTAKTWTTDSTREALGCLGLTPCGELCIVP